MSLDVSLLIVEPTEVFEANITHNLGKIAEAAGIYQHLWIPDEIGITKANELIDPLAHALNDMKQRKRDLNPTGQVRQNKLFRRKILWQ